VINQIKLENPHLWTERFKQELVRMIRDVVGLESWYAHDTIPRGVLGLNASLFDEYLKSITNRRCSQIGLPEQYPGALNPLPLGVRGAGSEEGEELLRDPGHQAPYRR